MEEKLNLIGENLTVMGDENKRPKRLKVDGQKMVMDGTIKLVFIDLG